MSDITICINKLCPIAGKCYRYTAPASDYQSVAMFEYTISKDGVKCDNFIRNREK